MATVRGRIWRRGRLRRRSCWARPLMRGLEWMLSPQCPRHAWRSEWIPGTVQGRSLIVFPSCHEGKRRPVPLKGEKLVAISIAPSHELEERACSFGDGRRGFGRENVLQLSSLFTNVPAYATFTKKGPTCPAGPKVGGDEDASAPRPCLEELDPSVP